MRMENFPSIENVINSKSKTQDSDYVNHTHLNNENSVDTDNVDVPKSKVDSVNDNHLGPTHDGLKETKTNSINDDSSSIDENHISTNARIDDPSKGISKTAETNGDINDTNEALIDPLTNKVSESIDSDKENDNAAVPNAVNDSHVNNDSLATESSRNDSLSTGDKNKTSTSCDSDDYLSATENNEVSDEGNKNQRNETSEEPLENGSLVDSIPNGSDTPDEQSNSNETQQNSNVTNDEVDNCLAKDNPQEFTNVISNSISNSVIEVPSIPNESCEKEVDSSADVSEPMEVDDYPSPVTISDCSEQNESKTEDKIEEKAQVTETDENSPKKDDQASTVTEVSEPQVLSDEETPVENVQKYDIESTQDTPAADSEEKSTADNATVIPERIEVQEEAATERSDYVEDPSKTSTLDTPNNKEGSSDEASKKSAEENASQKTTEVLHIDEQDDDLEEVMDTNECDPFAPTESTGVEIEEMEVDGTSSKDGQEDVEIEVVTEETLMEENSSNDAAAKSSQEKGLSTTEESTDQTDHCIIPDNVSNEAPKPAPQNAKKFDITPVRLEKLMDPSKLANSQERPVEIASDTVVANFTITSNRPQRRAAKKAESQIKEIVAQTEGENPFGNIEDIEQLSETSLQVCYRCSRLRQCKYVASLSSKTIYICQDNCLGNSVIAGEKRIIPIKCTSKLQIISAQKTVSSIPDSIHYLRKCSQCGFHDITDDKSLTWEAMDFCNEDCLGRYQTQNGAFCAYCKGNVQHTSMGKYSVRFGLEARQFCSGSCLEEFKKGLKSCSYCQQDITKATNVVSAQIGDKAQVKDFCSQSCVDKYERMSANLPLPVVQDMCTVCAQKKDVEVQVLIQSTTHSLCSDVCFMTFKFANNISDIDQCHICKKYYEDQNTESYFVFHEEVPYNFCSKVCMNVFILFRRKIVPCSWCKVKKYNFDMIKKVTSNGGCVMMCSLNCLTLYQVSINATSTRKIKCDLCSNVNYAQYHLTMSDATIRNFCSYNCVMVFQTQYNKTPLTVHEHNKSNVVVPLGGPKRTVFQHQKTVVSQTNDIQRTVTGQKTITTVANGLLPQFTANATTLKISSPLTVATTAGTSLSPALGTAKPPPPKYIQQIIVKPPEPKEMANKYTQCRPSTISKGTSYESNVETKDTQTDEHLKYPAVIPIPVPIYVPMPMHMFTTPFPVPVPFALPIPIPIFIPTTKNTYKGVVQYMKEIVDKTPTNPFEADLLLMAKMVAGEDKGEGPEEVTRPDSGEDDDMHFADAAPDLSDGENFADSETTVNNNFTEDVLQMALKMATEQLSNSPTVDLEAELTSNTITPQTQTEDTSITVEEPEVPIETKPPRTRKRTNKTSTDAPTRKRGRQQTAAQADTDSHSNTTLSQTSSDMSSPPLTAEGERPDVNMCLKYTIGIRAWKQWVLTKNEQVEQAAAAANKKAKTFNTNILKLTTDELNYLLCLFVKEVRKPDGIEYAPDTIYYLCLSIQQYLFENGRIDNIFTDTFYEPFTNALDDVAKKFSEVNDATQYIVTRVEEEHLWESKQLGAHSPHVLLATLMFFNTKYFNLATLEEHMQLSFSHIMKHWKRNPNTPIGKPGSPAPNRNVVLRFYPPQAALDAPNSRKKKVYEQHENEVNPLRCPVKLYEFYLSKCPESVKQRNDVFYLQPERSCVPDSPVWYSTMPLQKDLLIKMLHRVRMVKEVNISLLAS